MNETKFLYEKLEKWFEEKEINAVPIPIIIEKNFNPKLNLTFGFLYVPIN
ncbi:MAG: hypothetical protein I3273_02690 [Candidatus Moeniiplasma glomeromycotorum]|nr:hypothetical protein [Candidatus Moeniiplasma glomeromycotorum]MCE8167636.1 hypothetical protein [Candidatus Moeniiplasma glomeromycotorum]MCE8169013.1 hypothetical protein [Candidatus Moeniiplasma glomeromycotorum]